MKRIILIAAITLCSISSHAQVSFGAQVGANLGIGNTTIEDPYYGAASIANDPKVGILIGVLAEAEFGKLAFRPELNFIQKGSKSGYGAFTGGSAYSFKRTLNYIELPLNVVYNMNLGGKDNKLFFGLGPAFAFGISGKDKDASGKYDVKFDGKKSDDLNSNDIDTHLKRVDVGINLLAGYKLPMGLFGKIGFTYGLSNIDPNKDNAQVVDRSSYKNRGVNICVGYMMGGKKKK